MSLRFHEIAESRHRILNPFTAEKLALLGEVCELERGQRVLDLCCGKAEMLCTWSVVHGIEGVGVDISPVFLAAGRARAVELGVADKVDLVEGDAEEFVRAHADNYDVVTCIGATWIGGGLVGTLRLMRDRIHDDGLAVVGEPYWIDPLPDGLSMDGIAAEEFASLDGTRDRFLEAGYDVVEMVLADGDSWDRYMAAQWRTADLWLRANPADPIAEELRAWVDAAKRSHLSVGRRYLGWGCFVLRPVSG